MSLCTEIPFFSFGTQLNVCGMTAFLANQIRALVLTNQIEVLKMGALCLLTPWNCSLLEMDDEKKLST